jgi:plastocyanin
MKGIIIFGCGCVALTTCVLAGAEQNRTGGSIDTATGLITGRAQVRGTPAPAPRINIDSECAKIGSGDLYGEAVVADATGGLANVFVYVKEGVDPAANFDASADPAVITQRRCRFEPRVLGVQVGQPLAIVNEDQTLHNVHAKPMINPPFNIGQPIAGMRATRMFAHPEVMVPLTSDIRPWMAAFVAVVPHPFFAVSQSDGTFLIKGVPPGRYTIEAWHETLGTATDRITVVEGQRATISFTFAAR